jgi:hypothetical protein
VNGDVVYYGRERLAGDDEMKKCLGFYVSERIECAYCEKKKPIKKGAYIALICNECAKIPCWGNKTVKTFPCNPPKTLLEKERKR